MWNYYFAVQSTFILGIILVFYFSLPRLSIRMNRTFVHMLILQSLVIFFDIVSSWADNNYEIMSVSVLYLLNTAYFILFYGRAYVCFMFTADVYRIDPAENKLRTFLIRLPVIIGMILVSTSPLNGLVYSIKEDGYHSGPLYNILYVISYFYVILAFCVMFSCRYRLKKRRYKYCMLLFNLIIFVGLVMRWLFPAFLLMDTFCLMAVIAVYLTFQNPEFYLDLKGSVFNRDAFKAYIEENNGRLAYNILGVVVHNYYEMRDIYGGRQMDAGVSMIAKYLTETFPECNVFYYRRGRYILLGPRDMNNDEFMEEISERFEQPWISDDMELYLEPGYLTLDPGEKLDSVDVFLNTILAAMAKADKQDGKDPVIVTQDQIKKNEYETALKRYLESAVDQNKVEVFLQALVDAGTEKVVGAEALCRIRDAEGGLISPAVFIPIAERNGRINILGEQVFEKTCRFIKEHDLKKNGIDWINVNLSPMQFMKADLAERYAYIMRQYDIPPEMIHLEITEESMIDDVFLRKQIQAMQGKGFMFVLDDYGTGYSNLTRLKNCPFINVKLDMSIVRDYYSEPDELLPNMVHTFKHMNFGVTAEGIEDKAMAEMLRDIGCDYLQGYYYSKPVPMEEFAEKYLNG